MFIRRRLPGRTFLHFYVIPNEEGHSLANDLHSRGICRARSQLTTLRTSGKGTTESRALSGSRSAETRKIIRNDKIFPSPSGAIAQLGERIVRNDEVVGSIPTSSTKEIHAKSAAEKPHDPKFQG